MKNLSFKILYEKIFILNLSYFEVLKLKVLSILKTDLLFHTLSKLFYPCLIKMRDNNCKH